MRKRSPKYLIISLAVIGLLFILDFLFLSPDSETEKQMEHISLYRQNFTPYPLPEKIISELRPENVSQKATAFRVYQQGDYQEAVVQLKYVLIDQPRNAEVIFFLGVSSLASGDFEKAVEQFKTLLTLDEHSYQEAGYWYLSLGQLRLNQAAEAARTLNQIIQINSQTKFPVRELLQKLGS